MKNLLIYLKEYKKECALAPLFKMLEAILELFVPLAVAALIDEGIGHGRKGYIFGMVGLLFLMAAFGLAVAVTAQYFAAKAAVGFATNLRHALFSHLLKFSYTEIDEMGASTMITRMTTDIGSAQNGVNMVLRLLLRSPFVVFGAMIMAFTIDPWSATIFVMVICGLSVCVFAIMNFHIPMMKKIQQKLDKLTGAVRENLTGVRVLRAFVKEKEEIGRFGSRNEALLSEQEKTGMVSGLLNPLTFVVVNVGVILLLRTGAVQVGRGALSRGSVVALYNYMSQILVELIKLANLIVTINKALAGADRISEALAVNPSMVYGEAAEQTKTQTEPVIQTEQETPVGPATQTEHGVPEDAVVSFEHVSLTYKGAGQEALSDISFTAGKGQIIGIIGGTGCGKSSLVNLIPRFYDATEGSVKVFGKDVREYGKEELLSLVGIVPQKAQVFAGSIADNLRWGKENATEEELTKAAEMAQAADVVEAKGGLSGMIEQGGRNLSGGQKQRLTIARALTGDKPILILDDSSSALDMATDKRLRKALYEMENRPTIFIVSQRTTSIMDADMILVLDNGTLTDMGSHEQLLGRCELYQEIYDSQKMPAASGFGSEV